MPPSIVLPIPTGQWVYRLPPHKSGDVHIVSGSETQVNVWLNTVLKAYPLGNVRDVGGMVRAMNASPNEAVYVLQIPPGCPRQSVDDAVLLVSLFQNQVETRVARTLTTPPTVLMATTSCPNAGTMDSPKWKLWTLHNDGRAHRCVFLVSPSRLPPTVSKLAASNRPNSTNTLVPGGDDARKRLDWAKHSQYPRLRQLDAFLGGMF
jgi:hypothetical protein